MYMKKYGKIFLFFFLIILIGCQQKKDNTNQNRTFIPNQISNLKNLTVFSPEEQEFDTLELVRDQTYSDTGEIFIGWIKNIVVDNGGRVYIADGERGRSAIYVYTPDGRYLTTIGNFGKGPGEFESIGNMKIRNNHLYIYGQWQRKISVFSLDNFTHSHDVLLKRDSVKNEKELADQIPAGDLFIRNDGSFLMSFKSKIRSNHDRKILYYRLNKNGMILPFKILELKRYHYFTSQKSISEGGVIAFDMPFSRSSLMAVADNGIIYTAWTENFLIRQYDNNGIYQRAFYYPYQNSPLVASDLQIRSGMKIGQERKKVLSKADLPDSWPALHAMLTDDQNRLWIATITKDKNNYQWWVLSENGKLLGRFRFSGKRSWRGVASPNFDIVVKNGYFYTSDTNQETGQEFVVRYRINMY